MATLDKTYPKPVVHWDCVPDTQREDVKNFLEEYKEVWEGQIGKVDVTPHRI